MSLGHDFFNNDAYAKHLGIELLDERAGYAKTQLTIGELHLNGLGTAHGAAIFALADAALAVAANNRSESMGIGLQINTNFLSIAKLGDVLTAETSEVAIKNRIGNLTANVRNQEGELVASFQGMIYRKERK